MISMRSMTGLRIAIALLLILAFAAYRVVRRTHGETGRQGVAGSKLATIPDLVLVNGLVYTGDPAEPRAEAVAISTPTEEILAVGTTAEIRKLAGPSTRVVDLHGAFTMPGFNDAHTHVGGAGQGKLNVDLEGAASLPEFQQRIRARLRDFKPGAWITGRGWDHTLWPVKKFPTRADLDAVSRDHPMVFTRVDGHELIANSLALKLAGITKETKDPPGGAIERDASGEPTGMIKETAMGLVYGKVPAISADRRRRGIELALEDAVRHGVTSVQDNSNWEDFLVYRQLKQEDKLSVRITEWLPFQESLARLEQMRRDGGTTDPWLKTGAVKMVVDGSLGSRTAAMLAPYSDESTTSGILRIEPDRLTQMSIERDKAGFQLAFHAIGDRANRVALDAFAAAAKANGPRERRDRIEHAQVVAPSEFARFAQLHVIASMQPSHETTDMRWAEGRIGAERSKGAYAWRTFLNDSVRLAFGTDYPVETINPMRGLHACVTRELPDGSPSGGWLPQEKISMDECIAAYTSGSAYAEFEEGKKGRIAPGKYADIIVLSADVTKIPPAQIMKTEVLQTYAGGRLVYEKK
jgi:predicted amidohydrolase YtcJ